MAHQLDSKEFQGRTIGASSIDKPWMTWLGIVGIVWVDSLVLLLSDTARAMDSLSPAAGPADPPAACAALSTVVLGYRQQLKAEFVSGEFKVPGTKKVMQTPAFCRVVLHSSLSVGSSINHEVWLPSEWNGRLLGTGNAGWAGNIDYWALALGLKRGFATANTDMGTARVENGTLSAAIDPVSWLDYGQRATHDMTASAKVLIAAFYGRPERHSYFQGCSTGGFQGLRSAELFPADYDGIIAGHPGDRRAAKVISILYNYMQPKLHPEGISRMTS